jgi:hypothetical protein
MENSSQVSQIPLRVLKADHRFLHRVKLVMFLRINLGTLLRITLVTLLRGNLITYLKVKLDMLCWATLVILPRDKWFFLLLL